MDALFLDWWLTNTKEQVRLHGLVAQGPIVTWQVLTGARFGYRLDVYLPWNADMLPFGQASGLLRPELELLPGREFGRLPGREFGRLPGRDAGREPTFELPCEPEREVRTTSSLSRTAFGIVKITSLASKWGELATPGDFGDLL
eukprot:CAMPEP_0174695146 /NCGR_PEP_ID=MMETSP1094-20130205/1589_1 /TAXON_ID=156173 /ORGANISM="Chrysochromulina brevifilum, Strain UTEX LB 985" /LENGTH=143 /DNA_ID=CAMNT_0015891573 /DNA_START=421 /DNA_END=850 /DNA_ORIENTATION=+